MPAWGWWHGCHRLLLSHMALHYNAASESKSPRRRRPVCLADRLCCKRLVIARYSKQHNCLVKDEWRQIGLRMFRLFPWSAPVEWACVSEHKREVTMGPASSSSTKGRGDKTTYGDCAAVPPCVAGQDQWAPSSAGACVAGCLLVHSYIPSLCVSIPSASVVLACLVNLCRSPWIFRLTWLTSGVCSIGNRFFSPAWWMQLGADPCSWVCGGVSLCVAPL